MPSLDVRCGNGESIILKRERQITSQRTEPPDSQRCSRFFRIFLNLSGRTHGTRLRDSSHVSGIETRTESLSEAKMWGPKTSGEAKASSQDTNKMCDWKKTTWKQYIKKLRSEWWPWAWRLPLKILARK